MADIVVNETRNAAIQRMMLLASQLGEPDPVVVYGGVRVTQVLFDAYAADIITTPLVLATDPSAPCPRGMPVTGFSLPGLPGATGPTGPAGPAGEPCEPEDPPPPCDIMIGDCNDIDPDVAAIFYSTFECLENMGIISGTWRNTLPSY